MQYSIGIATEESFRYIKLTDAKIWISKMCHYVRFWQIGSHINNKVEVTVCIKQFTTDYCTCFITVGCFVENNQHLCLWCVIVLLYIINHVFLWIWSVFEQLRTTVCGCLIANQMEKVPTIYFKFMFDHLMKYVDAYGYKV